MPESGAISDVVVIGAGVTGALIARRMAEANLHVAVLEARPLAGDVFKGSPQMAFLGTPQSFASLADSVSAENALKVWEMTRDSLELLERTAARFGVPTRRVASLRLAQTAEDAERLQESEQVLRRAGYRVSLEDATDWGYLVALRTPDNLMVEAAPLIQALLQHPRIHVETGVDVSAVIPKGPTLEVVARRRFLTTHGVVLSTGAYAVRFSPALQRMVRPLSLHSVLCRAELLFTVPLILHEGQTVLHPQNAHWRLTAWTAQDEPRKTWRQLGEAAQTLCPTAMVTERRSHWVAVTPDGMPAVGELPDLPGAYLASGLGPWGLSWVGLVAERLCALMLHDQQPGVLGLRRLGRF